MTKYSPGDWIQTDINGRVLRISQTAPGNGLGRIYRVLANGKLQRVFGL